MRVAKCRECGRAVPEVEPGIGEFLCPDCQGRQEYGQSAAPMSTDDQSVPLRGEISRGRLSSPTKLAPWDYYLISDHHDIVARWENDGRGWMLNRRDGFVRARHMAEEIPWFGQFVLIDIGVGRDGHRTYLSHVTAYSLQDEFALMQLVKSDIAILNTITGPAQLTEPQKELVRDFVKSRYLRYVWHTLDDLLEAS